MAQVLCPVVIGRDAALEAVDAALTAAAAVNAASIASSSASLPITTGHNTCTISLV